ncbi:hypothetical protein AB0E96_22950 [Kitasatospora sp. NPDC036755]|uniref:SMODS domain-containing nucleotidyltransferase n=1 Tax=Kitasatospora sp. NPDC036755 TaxID=3154600 RepID=UPI00340CC357
MGIDAAFDAFQRTVNEDIEQVKLARQRRDIFKRALLSESEVTEAFGSGSLSRSTQLKPIHDVDVIAVYDASLYPHWGTPGDSAADALDHARRQINRLLGATHGTFAQEVRLADPRNHAIKCFLDDPDDPDAFTVDLMPALRQADGSLLIPEKLNNVWVPANPEYLIAKVADRQAEWGHFRPMVRVLKDWRQTAPVDGRVKSLVMEVLALHCLPTGGNRANGLKSFFTSAAVHVREQGVHDPANLCGPIQPDLNTPSLAAAFDDAADIADRACAAAAAGDTDGAQRMWQQILGDNFPAPAAPAKKASAAVSSAPALLVSRPVKDAPQG